MYYTLIDKDCRLFVREKSIHILEKRPQAIEIILGVSFSIPDRGKTMTTPEELQLVNYSTLPNKILRDPAYLELDTAAFTAWQLIFNRYQSSRHKARFWDAKHQDWYAIYPLKELTLDLHCGLSKAARTLKALINVGLLETRRVGLSRAYRLFPKVPYVYTKAGWQRPVDQATTVEARDAEIKQPTSLKKEQAATHRAAAQSFICKTTKPKLTEQPIVKSTSQVQFMINLPCHAENETRKTPVVTTALTPKNSKTAKKAITNRVVAQPFILNACKRSNVTPNYLIFNYLTSDTTNTFNPAQGKITTAPTSPQKVEAKSDSSDAQALHALAQNYTSHYGLPASAVSVIKAYSEKSATKFMHYMELLFQAKKTAVKYVRAHVSAPIDLTLLQNETNTLIQTSLGVMLQRLFIYMRKNTDNLVAADKYFKRAVDNFYQETFNASLQGITNN